MKTLTQLVIPLVIIVGIVGGVTFVRQYNATAPATPPPTESVASSATANFPLFLPVKAVEWTPAYAGEVEEQVPGHHDFWFENRNDFPVLMGVYKKNCTCSHVEVAVLTEEEGKKYKEWSAEAGAQPGKQAPPDQAATGGKPNGRGPAPELKWQQLELDDSRTAGVLISPKAAGMIRVGWKDKNSGAERLTAELWSQAQQGQPSAFAFQRVEVPLTIVPAVRVASPDVNAGELFPGGTAEVQFNCWSSTRPAMSLAAVVRGGDDKIDPCFTVETQPLSKEECTAFSEAQVTRVLSGYRVNLKIKERLSDSVQLDLGPFRRKLVLTTDLGVEPPALVVTGIVRGDVLVGNQDDKDRLVLGYFPAERGTKKNVILTTTQPGVVLVADGMTWQPEFLNVQLKQVGPTRWLLNVESPPGRAAGAFPPGSAVTIQLQEGSMRRIRIPVAGMAYQR